MEKSKTLKGSVNSIEKLRSTVELVSQKREALKLELAADILRSSGQLQFMARGASMIPAIFPSDILLVRQQPLAIMRCGDVALWSGNGSFCAHRVLRFANTRGQEGIVTRGDALREEDALVTTNEFLGHVHAVIRRGKHIELCRKQHFLSRGIALLTQRSDFLARCLLRYNSLWRRIAKLENSFAKKQVTPPEMLGCS